MLTLAVPEEPELGFFFLFCSQVVRLSIGIHNTFSFVEDFILFFCVLQKCFYYKSKKYPLEKTNNLKQS